MKRFILAAAVVAAAWCSYNSTHAGRWIFRRSYYSHGGSTEVQIGPRLSGGPYYTRPQGAYVNGGYRYVRGLISVRGHIFDNLNLYESWYQYGEQY